MKNEQRATINLTSFLLALQFLTIIPARVKRFDPEKMAWSTAYFPIVGCLIGLSTAILYFLLLSLDFPVIASSLISVIAGAVLTAGLHLDGLADTVDGLAGAVDTKRSLEIMREPQIGSFGATAIASDILLKAAFLSALSPEFALWALILMTALGRWSMVQTMFYFPYARTDGKASSFSGKIKANCIIIAAIFTLIPLLLILKIKGFLLFLVVSVFSFLFAKTIKAKIQGYTGDTLGATNEVSEIFTLMCMTILERI